MKRPLLWSTAAISVAIYWDDRALMGKFIYDDIASIINNGVVTGGHPWWPDAFTRDFWGEPMKEPRSNKSYRPITTLTFRWNWSYASQHHDSTDSEGYTYYFHMANVLLHGINTGLVTEIASSFVFGGEMYPSLAVGLLFGLHPVHAEAVSNITSRGELLMTLFWCLAFLSYASHIRVNEDDKDEERTMIEAASEVAKPTTECREGNGEKVEESTASSNESNGNNNASDEKRRKDKTSLAEGENLRNGNVASRSTAADDDDDAVTAATSSSSTTRHWFDDFVFVYCLPCLFMTLSLFSKEQGATTLCTLVAYDFIVNHGSVRRLMMELQNTNDTDPPAARRARQFLKRTTILALQTITVIGVRYWLNGESSANFVFQQNPQGFTKQRFGRVFSVNWIYCLYIRDLFVPVWLAPDWSGNGIPIVTSFLHDKRSWCVVLLWVLAFGCVYNLLVGGDGDLNDGTPAATSDAQQEEEEEVAETDTTTTMVTKSSLRHRRQRTRNGILVAFFAFMFLPFLLSSNLLVTTGLAKADRVIYLPSFGFCVMEAILLSMHWIQSSATNRFVASTLLGIQLSLYAIKTQERNLAWSNELDLWVKAHEVNPRSYHTMFNAGRLLAKDHQWEKAERVLRPIKEPSEDGDSNTSFLYTVALSKLNRCDESFPLIDRTIKFIHEQREKGGLRYDERMSLHEESSLVVSRAFCTQHPMEKGRLLYEAVTLDPNNGFAATQLQNYMNVYGEALQKMQAMQQQQMMMQQQQQQQQRQRQRHR